MLNILAPGLHPRPLIQKPWGQQVREDTHMIHKLYGCFRGSVLPEEHCTGGLRTPVPYSIHTSTLMVRFPHPGNWASLIPKYPELLTVCSHWSLDISLAPFSSHTSSVLPMICWFSATPHPPCELLLCENLGCLFQQFLKVFFKEKEWRPKLVYLKWRRVQGNLGWLPLVYLQIIFSFIGNLEAAFFIKCGIITQLSTWCMLSPSLHST